MLTTIPGACFHDPLLVRISNGFTQYVTEVDEKLGGMGTTTVVLLMVLPTLSATLLRTSKLLFLLNETLVEISLGVTGRYGCGISNGTYEANIRERRKLLYYHSRELQPM